MKKINNLLILLLILYITSCRKFVVADPPVTAISSATAFSDNAGAIATMTSIYIDLKANPIFIAGVRSIGLLTGMESDELINFNSEYTGYFTNSLDNANSSLSYGIWQQIYAKVHTANLVIENLEKSVSISSAVKQQMIGEAKFMRAFLHFYLVNLFGKVPVITTSDYRINKVIARSDTNSVYRQIVADLKDAQSSLPDEIVDGYGVAVNTRYRPNRWAATALLSRVYLYQKDWVNAEAESMKFANNSRYYLDTDLINIFTGPSNEVIWQLQAVLQYFSAADGSAYILLKDPNLCAISPQLASAFEPGDARYSSWVGKYSSNAVDYYYPFKYRVSSDNDYLYLENTTVLRVAEQLLISAEAKIQQGKIEEGIADMNKLRQRSRLIPTSDVPNPLPDLLLNLSKEDALKAVMHERQVELFTEWGHRWFDLKRTGEINSVMTSVAPSKNTEWHPYQAWWPVPNSEILLNGNLDQNEGYN
jgi:starch-binding outer membrane protein, SusD/RagB family